jgi:hypothetical protein
MAGLKKALAQAERHVQGEDVGGANVAEDEDDPPIASVDDMGSSESLEAKGMIRKALLCRPCTNALPKCGNPFCRLTTTLRRAVYIHMQ